MPEGQAIVVHVTSGDADDFQQALRNLSNLFRNDDVPTPADVMNVVVNGDAVRFLLAGAPEAERVGAVTDAGIHVQACATSMKRNGHDPADLAPGVTTVASGVAEVARLQRMGAVYLKLP